MSRIAAILLITLLTLGAYTPVRPPVPTNIPFPYDPNIVPAGVEILGWKEVDPNTVVNFSLKVTEPDGQPVTVTGYFHDGTSVWVPPSPSSTVADPNDPDAISLIYWYNCDFLSGGNLGVKCFVAKGVDPNYPDPNSWDERAILFNVRIPPKPNRAPVLDWLP